MERVQLWMEFQVQSLSLISLLTLGNLFFCVFFNWGIVNWRVNFCSTAKWPNRPCFHCSDLSPVQLCGSMDCSPPRSSVRGVLLERMLDWGAISWVHVRIECLLHWVLPPGKHSVNIHGNWSLQVLICFLLENCDDDDAIILAPNITLGFYRN